MAFIDLSSEQSLEHVNSGTPGGMIISGQLYNEYLKKCTDFAHDYRQRRNTQLIPSSTEFFVENYDKIDDPVGLVNNIVKHNACFWHDFIETNSKKFFLFVLRISYLNLKFGNTGAI